MGLLRFREGHRTWQLSLMALMAALYVVFSFVPGIRIPGLPSLKIQVEALFASIVGVLLGPFYGSISIFLGTLLALYLPPGGPSLISFLFLPCPAFNALISGLLYEKMWKPALIFLLFPVVAIILSPIFNPLLQHWYVLLMATYDKILVLLLAPVLNVILRRNRFLGFILLCFIGAEADNILGNAIFSNPLIYRGVFGISEKIARGLYVAGALFYPLLRLLQGFIAGVVLFSLYSILSKEGESPIFRGN